MDTNIKEEICNYPKPLSNYWFNFQRDEGYPTRYPDHVNLPAHVDVLTAGLILAFVIIAVCIYVILPGYNCIRGCSIFAYATASLFIGGVIIVGNFGHEWEVGKVEIISQYKPGSSEELHAHLGLHIALRGINITLKEYPIVTGRNIDYNEHFSWEWAQGRFGFGKYAGRFSREFRAGVQKGLPYPILQVAEYFTFDGEGIRFGRHYRLAGWYAHLLMWAAVPCWLMANILFCSTVKSGAKLLGLAGLLQLIAIGIWTFLRNPIPLEIPFETPKSHHASGEVILRTNFGPDYYIVLFNGILCLLLGPILFLLAEFMPDEMCSFFGIDPLTSYEESVPSKAEMSTAQKNGIMKPENTMDEEKGEFIPLLRPGGNTERSEYGSDNPEDLCEENATVFSRKKTTKRMKAGFRAMSRTIRRTSVRFEKPSALITEEDEKESFLQENNGNVREEDEETSGTTQTFPQLFNSNEFN